jgi:hypothetical protein
MEASSGREPLIQAHQLLFTGPIIVNGRPSSVASSRALASASLPQAINPR